MVSRHRRLVLCTSEGPIWRCRKRLTDSSTSAHNILTQMNKVHGLPRGRSAPALNLRGDPHARNVVQTRCPIPLERLFRHARGYGTQPADGTLPADRALCRDPPGLAERTPGPGG